MKIKCSIFFVLFSTGLLAEETATTPANVFTDKDGDTITILDTKVRERLKPAKSIKASHVYDNEADIEKYKKDFEKDALNKERKTGEYIVLEGDTLKGISQKLYGTSKKWLEIQVLNEGLLLNTTIKVGMKLRYFIYTTEEKKNGPDVESDKKSDPKPL